MTVLSAPRHAEVDVSAVPVAWQRWAASALLHGVPLDATVAEMAQSGFPAPQAYALCLGILDSPAFAAARHGADALRKLESVLAARRQMSDLSPAGRALEVREGVDGGDFLDDYYAANTPVVLTDVARGWPALSTWSSESLAAVLGDEPVEIMDGREGDEDYEFQSSQHRQTVPFRQYAERVASSGTSNDAYLVANNHLLERDGAAPLWRDFTIDRRYLDPAVRMGRVFLWYGPAGTVTPLHHDVANVLFVQVRGRKRLQLFSPLDTPNLYNDRAVYSRVDAEDVDLQSFPKAAAARRFEVVVGPGDAVFLPVGWWHQVTALDESMSLSFTNFRWPNSFSWHHPTPLT